MRTDSLLLNIQRLSETAKSLRADPACRLTSLPASVTQMLAADRRLLGET